MTPSISVMDHRLESPGTGENGGSGVGISDFGLRMELPIVVDTGAGEDWLEAY